MTEKDRSSTGSSQLPSEVIGRRAMSETPSDRYTVTMTDENGTLLFVGRPAPGVGDFRLIRQAGKPARLICDVLDLSVRIARGGQ